MRDTLAKICGEVSSRRVGGDAALTPVDMVDSEEQKQKERADAAHEQAKEDAKAGKSKKEHHNTKDHHDKENHDSKVNSEKKENAGKKENPDKKEQGKQDSDGKEKKR